MKHPPAEPKQRLHPSLHALIQPESTINNSLWPAVLKVDRERFSGRDQDPYETAGP